MHVGTAIYSTQAVPLARGWGHNHMGGTAQPLGPAAGVASRGLQSLRIDAVPLEEHIASADVNLTELSSLIDPLRQEFCCFRRN